MSKLSHLHKLADPDIRAKNLEATRYWLRGKFWDLAGTASPDPVFVVGCSRSGTTVTYETLAASSELLSFGYELPQLWNGLWGPRQNEWDSEAAGEEHARSEHRTAAQRFFFQRLGAGRVVDKTCINVMRIPYLYRLFPDARFVYIHRDGRDNVSSLMDGWRLGEHFGLEQFLGDFPSEVAINAGEFRQWRFFLPPGWREYNRASLEEVCAHQWRTANTMALDAQEMIPDDQWIQVRYEDIFEHPVEMFQEIFRRLDLPFEDPIRERCTTLSSRPTSIVKGAPQRQKWKMRNREAVERILDRIAPVMQRLGYSMDE